MHRRMHKHTGGNVNKNEAKNSGANVEELLRQATDPTIMDEDKQEIVRRMVEKLGAESILSAGAAPDRAAEPVQGEPCFSAAPAEQPAQQNGLLDGVLGLSGFWQEGAVRAICGGNLAPQDARALADTIEHACDGISRNFSGAELKRFNAMLAETAQLRGWDAACALELVLCDPSRDGRKQAADRLRRLAANAAG